MIDTDNGDDIAYKNISGRDPFNQNFRKILIQNSVDRFGPTGKVSKKKGPPFEVDHFSRSDRLEFAPSVSPNGISCKFLTLGWPVPILTAYMKGDSF